MLYLLLWNIKRDAVFSGAQGLWRRYILRDGLDSIRPPALISRCKRFVTICQQARAKIVVNAFRIFVFWFRISWHSFSRSTALRVVEGFTAWHVVCQYTWHQPESWAGLEDTESINFKRIQQLNLRKASFSWITVLPENRDSTETTDDDFAESPSWFKWCQGQAPQWGTRRTLRKQISRPGVELCFRGTRKNQYQLRPCLDVRQETKFTEFSANVCCNVSAFGNY